MLTNLPMLYVEKYYKATSVSVRVKSLLILVFDGI